MAKGELYAVIRYPSTDDYIRAQEAMSNYDAAMAVAVRQSREDSEAVYLVVRCATVVAGAGSSLNMDTIGGAQ